MYTTGETQTGNLTKRGTKVLIYLSPRCPFFIKAWKFLPAARCSLANASSRRDTAVTPLAPPAPRPPGPWGGLHHLPPAKGHGGHARPERGHRSPHVPGPPAADGVRTPPAHSGAAAGQGRRARVSSPGLPALPRRLSSGRGSFSDPEHEPGASPGRSPRRLAPLRRDWARGGGRGPRAGGLGPGGEGAGGRRCSSVPHDDSPEAAATPEEAGRHHLASSLRSPGRCPETPRPLRQPRLGFGAAPRSSRCPRSSARSRLRGHRQQRHPRARAHWDGPVAMAAAS